MDNIGGYVKKKKNKMPSLIEAMKTLGIKGKQRLGRLSRLRK